MTQPVEVKFTYIRLNSQTACPPRTAVPVNQGGCGRLFHSQQPDRLRSWLRPFLLLGNISETSFLSERLSIKQLLPCAFECLLDPSDNIHRRILRSRFNLLQKPSAFPLSLRLGGTLLRSGSAGTRIRAALVVSCLDIREQPTL